MKIKTCFAAVALASMMALPQIARADSKLQQQAIELYNHGMYSQAMELFRQDSQDPLSYDYSVLCAVKLGLKDCAGLVAAADTLHSRTLVNSAIHHEWGLQLFDAKQYAAAAEQFAKVDAVKLKRGQKAEFYYKYGLSLYNSGELAQAVLYLQKVEEMHPGELLAVNRFTLGTVEYAAGNFDKAARWFSMAAEDERFREIADFYLVDCRFMAKDYDYVVREGERIFPQLSEERGKYLSRIMSESYLVKGDASKAQEYLDKEDKNMSNMSNEDLFHAASVLYAVNDYQGALPYFQTMILQKDSLSQVAAYQKGYSLVETKNKVAALDAFKFASALNFDESIKEDAFFNYAKLSFDLNSDSKPFQDYLSVYSTSRKGEVIYNYIALAALQEKNYSAAVAAYDNIDELNEEQKHNYVKANFLRAEQLIRAGSYKAAVPYIKASAYYLPKTDPFNQFARYHLAETYYHSGMQKEALQVYTDLYNTSALNNRAEGNMIPYNMAYCYFASKNYQSAAKWYDVYIKSADKAARRDALLRRADCDFLRKDFKSAVDSYQKVVSEYPGQNDLYPHYQLAMASGLSGDIQRKISVLAPLSGAASSKPFYAESMYELGRAYVETGKETEAVSAFNKLMACAKDSVQVARALVGIGLAQKNAGNYEKALKSYGRVVKMKPRNEYFSDALLSIQTVYQAQGHPEKYLEYLEANNLTSTQSAAEKEELYFSTAEQVFITGNYQGAISSVNRYISAYPSGKHVADAYYYMAESYKHLGDKERALDAYIQSLEISRDGSYAKLSRLNIASINYSLERYEEAYDVYKVLGDMEGMMRSAYAASMFQNAIDAANTILRRQTLSANLQRECQYVLAKSYLSTSRRDEAFALLTKLSESPSTAEGAEAYYLIIKSRFDWGKFDQVESGVYDFAASCGNQVYWLAKAYIVLGDSFIEKGNPAQALVTFESIRDGYEPSGPDDDVMDAVMERINTLKSE